MNAQVQPQPRIHSDADIARSAADTLLRTSFLPKYSVMVMVKDGWITMYGEVDWDYQRQTAREAVRHLAGVSGVSDRLAIKSSMSLNAIKSDVAALLNKTLRY